MAIDGCRVVFSPMALISAGSGVLASGGMPRAEWSACLLGRERFVGAVEAAVGTSLLRVLRLSLIHI